MIEKTNNNSDFRVANNGKIFSTMSNIHSHLTDIFDSLTQIFLTTQ